MLTQLIMIEMIMITSNLIKYELIINPNSPYY